jgi:hypothetical protein
MAHQAERDDWIIKWLQAHTSANSCDSEFHDAYTIAFPRYTRKLTSWGAQPVGQAMRDLARLHNAGIIERHSIALGLAWQPGFPRWVWSYSLT